MEDIDRIYSVTGIDSEQLNEDSLLKLIGDYNEKLIQLSSDHYYRFVKISGEIFCQSNSPEIMSTFEGQEVTPSYYCEKSFGMEDVYTSDEGLHDNHHSINTSVFSYVRVLGFKSCSFGELMGIGDYLINFRRLTDGTSKSKLEFGRSQHSSSFSESKANHEGENAYTQNDDILRAVIEGREALFSTELFFIARGASLEESQSEVFRIVRECKRKGIEVLIETMGSKYCIENYSLATEPEFINSFSLNSSFLVNLIPIHRDRLLDKGFDLYSKSGNLIQYDLFHYSNLNYNAVVAGPSGSGKTFFIGAVCLHYYRQGVNVLNIERGDSMLKLGTISNATNLLNCFNPLFSKNREYLYQFLLSNIPDNEISKKEKGRLKITIEDLELTGIDTFDEFLDLLDKDFPELRYYMIFLKPYISNEKLELNSFSHVNIESLPDDVLAPFIIFVLEYMDSLKGRTILFLDEVHSLLKKNKQFVEMKYREGRKKNQGILSATHDVNEFTSDPVGQVIFKCSHTKIVFNQGVYPQEGITQFQCDKISQAKTVPGQYSEFVLMSENFTKAVRYFSTPYEYEVLTTNAVDNERINEWVKDRLGIMSYEEALRQYVEVKYVY
jgi:type IV secretory pathway VirB4 component